MTEQTVIAFLGVIGVVGAAMVTAVSVVLGLLWKRIAALEQSERDLWWWARIIADQYYRWRRPDAPDLPAPPARQGEKK